MSKMICRICGDRTEKERVLIYLAETLEKAQTGLQWYLGEYPDYKSPADDEMHEEIDIALARYRKVMGIE